MNDPACPKCGEPVPPAVIMCPSCKQLVRGLGAGRIPRSRTELPSGPPSQELLDELQCLREWTGEGRTIRPLISIRTMAGAMIFLIAVVACLLALRFSPDYIPLLLVAGLVSGMLTLVAGVNDLMLMHVRRLGSPEDLTTYFFRCLKNGRHKAAMDAVADYPGSDDWRKGFARDWKDRTGGTTIGRAVVKEVQDLSVDMMLLRIQVELSTRSTTGFLVLGILGSILFATKQTLEVKKLAVLRGGRWYFVTSFSNGVHDRRLMRALQGTPEGESGPAEAGEEDPS